MEDKSIELLQDIKKELQAINNRLKYENFVQHLNLGLEKSIKEIFKQ